MSTGGSTTGARPAAGIGRRLIARARRSKVLDNENAPAPDVDASDSPDDDAGDDNDGHEASQHEEAGTFVDARPTGQPGQAVVDWHDDPDDLEPSNDELEPAALDPVDHDTTDVDADEFVDDEFDGLEVDGLENELSDVDEFVDDEPVTDELAIDDEGWDDVAPHEGDDFETAADDVVDDGRASLIASAFAVFGIAAGLAVWAVGVASADGADENEFGLLSTMTVTAAVGIGLISIGFAAAFASRARVRPFALFAGVAGFATVLHAPGALLGDRLRGAWGRANAAVADGVIASGDIDGVASSDPELALADLPDWPGVRSLVATVADASGLSPDDVVRWMPFAILALGVGGIWMLVRALGGDERVAAAAQWCFVAGSWLGTEQVTSAAIASVVALATLAVLLPFDRRHDPEPTFTRIESPSTRGALSVAVGLAFVAAIAVAVTNPLFGLVLAASFFLAAITRASFSWWAGVIVGLAALGWAFGPARSTLDNTLRDLLAHRGASLEAVLGDLGGTAGERWDAVLIAGRLGLQLIAVLAIAGFVRRFRHGQRIALLVALSSAPFLVAVLVGPSLDHLLRAAFVALPWLAIAAGYGVEQALRPRREGGDIWLLLGRLAFVGILAASALIAVSGQERARDLASTVSGQVANADGGLDAGVEP